MTSSLAAILGGAVTAAYIPILRNQIRDGEVSIPFGSINPIRIRKDEHPLAFRLAAYALVSFVAFLLIACIAILVRSIA